MSTAAIDDHAVQAPPAPTRVLRPLLVVTAAVTVLWLLVLFAWSDAPFAFTYDDAYYYFGIARNVAAGHGSTFDGINLTNGYHPLWLLVSTIPFALGLDDLGAARFLLALQLVVGWGASLALVAALLDRSLQGWPRRGRTAPAAAPAAPAASAALAADRRAATFVLALVFALVAVNPFVVKIFVNGLETGITVTLLTWLLLVGSAPRASWLGDTSSRWRLGVGALLAVLFLGRTDSVLLIGCLFLWCAAEAWRARRATAGESGAAGRSARRVPVAAFLQLFGPAAVVIAVYLASNVAFFGTPFQISGLVKRAPLTPVSVVTFGAIALLAWFVGRRGFLAAHGRRAKRQPRFPHVTAFAGRTSWFAAFCVLLVGYYTVLQTQIWPWYFAPLILYMVILFLLAIADMTEVALRDARPERSPGRAVAPLAVLFAVLLGGALVYEVGAFRDPDLLSIQLADRDAGLWLRDHTDERAVAAAWDAGVTGYFSHRHVMNLDGLVSSHEYYEAFRRGKQADFVRCRGMTYLTNHGGSDEAEDRSFRTFLHDVYGEGAARDARVVYRAPFLFSGTTTGSAGTDAPGTREMTSWIYEVAPATPPGAPPC